MRTTIDSAGRLVVPKSLRDALHLKGGSEVDLTERNGVIEVSPACAEVTIVDGPDGPVAVATSETPLLDDSIVLATLDSVRR